MSSDSIRLHVPAGLHQHDDPAENDAVPLPEVESGPGPLDSGRHENPRLWRENGLVRYQDDGMDEPVAVRLLWARPLSGRNGPVSVVVAGKKKEVAYFPSPDSFPEPSRTVALEELAAGLVMPRVVVIHGVNPRFGNYYWDVGTDMGRRTFLLVSPENNSFRPNADSVILRDVSGNCYEIASVSGLDPASRREMDKVL